MDGAFFPTYDDGRRLYGFAGRKFVSVNPRTGGMKRVASFRTPSGTRFTRSVGRRLEVGLPSGQLSIPLTTASGARARVGHLSRQLVGATGVHVFARGRSSTALGSGRAAVTFQPDRPPRSG